MFTLAGGVPEEDTMTTWKKPSGAVACLQACGEDPRVFHGAYVRFLLCRVLMFSQASTHKRKRSAARRDDKHSIYQPIGSILVSTTQGRSEKEGALDYIHETIQSHPFNHQVSP